MIEWGQAPTIRGGAVAGAVEAENGTSGWESRNITIEIGSPEPTRRVGLLATAATVTAGPGSEPGGGTSRDGKGRDGSFPKKEIIQPMSKTEFASAVLEEIESIHLNINRESQKDVARVGELGFEDDLPNQVCRCECGCMHGA